MAPERPVPQRHLFRHVIRKPPRTMGTYTVAWLATWRPTSCPGPVGPLAACPLSCTVPAGRQGWSQPSGTRGFNPPVSRRVAYSNTHERSAQWRSAHERTGTQAVFHLLLSAAVCTGTAGAKRQYCVSDGRRSPGTRGAPSGSRAGTGPSYLEWSRLAAVNLD